MKNILHKVSLPAVLVVGLVVGLAGFAYAAIPDAQGVIHGCYRSSGLLANGALRIIDSDTQACNNNEDAISWNQTGPQGPPGQNDSQVIANHIETPQGATNQPFITIPDFGELTAGCSGVSAEHGLFYRNTTNNVVIFDSPAQLQIQPGQMHQFGNIISTRTTTLAYGNGVGSRIALLSVVGSQFNVPPFQCAFSATAIVKQN